MTTTSTGRATTPAAATRAETLRNGWQNRSGCYNRPTEWWNGDRKDATERARNVCRACPVLADCLGDTMKEERSVLWSRTTVRGGLTGPERVQLFMDHLDYGEYDAEEARILALEAIVLQRPVTAGSEEVSKSTLRLAQRLAGQHVPVRKPPSAVQLRGGTAKERAYRRAQDILEWREAGMTVRAIAAELKMGRETVQDLLRAFSDLVNDDAGTDDRPGLNPQVLDEFLSGPDTFLPVDMQVLAIAEAVSKGMRYPQIDTARKLPKGHTASFVSRQRKQYERDGREFPVQVPSGRALTDEQVLEMRHRYAEGGVTDLQLAMRYGVPRNLVTNVLSGKNYKHVGGPIRVGRSKEGVQASRDHMCGHGAGSLAAMSKVQMKDELEEAA